MFQYLVVIFILYPVYTYLTSSLHRIPGPLSYSLTKWRLALEDFRARRTRIIHSLHQRHGPVVRIGPQEVSFASLLAQRTIYGAGSGFERTPFYRMFDVYGRQNLFTISSVEDHSRRKKMLHHVYSKSYVLNSSDNIVQKVRDFLNIVEDGRGQIEIYSAMLFYSLHNITHFLYGTEGATSALQGNKAHQIMLNDQRDPARRKMAWFSTHMKWYTRWLSKQSGRTERLLSSLGFYPQRKPFVYTGIREYALKVYCAYKPSTEDTIIGRLKGSGQLDDLDVASECADHFLAGINTTSDTLFFMLWILSRPENKAIQQRLIDELRSAGLIGTPSPKDLSRVQIPYFDAVIQETLRLYAPLPASEPRVYSKDTTIDGYLIPAGTVVSCQPYTLHRNPEVFASPEIFVPERWLSPNPDLKRWWWAFSSGGRMCIGEHLAMAEISALLSGIYLKYRTRLMDVGEYSPGINSRFELFFDGRFTDVRVFLYSG